MASSALADIDQEAHITVSLIVALTMDLILL